MTLTTQFLSSIVILKKMKNNVVGARLCVPHWMQYVECDPQWIRALVFLFYHRKPIIKLVSLRAQALYLPANVRGSHITSMIQRWVGWCAYSLSGTMWPALLDFAGSAPARRRGTKWTGPPSSQKVALLRSSSSSSSSSWFGPQPPLPLLLLL